jgi:hypothetical protein
MNFPGVTIQKAYYDRLTSPAIMAMGRVVPVYSDIAPSKSDRPYIILSSQSAVDESDKTAYRTNFTQAVTIATFFDGDRGTKKVANDIADQVIERIRTRSFGFIGTTFHAITSILDNSFTIVERLPGQTVIRMELRFRHNIQQYAPLPSGFAYVTDESGNIITDDRGNFVIVPA